MDADIQETPDQSAEKNCRDQFEGHKTRKLINASELDSTTEVNTWHPFYGNPTNGARPLPIFLVCSFTYLLGYGIVPRQPVYLTVLVNVKGV